MTVHSAIHAPAAATMIVAVSLATGFLIGSDGNSEITLRLSPPDPHFRWLSPGMPMYRGSEALVEYFTSLGFRCLAFSYATHALFAGPGFDDRVSTRDTRGFDPN